MPLAKLACRIMLGERIADARPAGRAPGPRLRRPRVGQGGGAAVRPLRGLRRAARTGDALDRRGDGHRPRLPDRVRQGPGRRRRAAAAQRAPCSSPSPTPTRPAPAGIAQTLHDNGFRILATRGTAEAIARMGVPVQRAEQARRGLAARARLDRAGGRRPRRQHAHRRRRPQRRLGDPPRRRRARDPLPDDARRRGTRRRARSPVPGATASPRCCACRSSTASHAGPDASARTDATPLGWRAEPGAVRPSAVLEVAANERLGAYRVLRVLDPGGASRPGAVRDARRRATAGGAGRTSGRILPRAFSVARQQRRGGPLPARGRRARDAAAVRAARR